MLTLDGVEQKALHLEEYARAKQQAPANSQERVLADTLLRHAVGALSAIRKWRQQAETITARP